MTEPAPHKNYRRAVLPLLIAGLLAAGCSDDGGDPQESPDDTTVTTSSGPELTDMERQEAAQEQVVDFYEQLVGDDFKDDDGYLTEAASAVAHHDLIDQYNETVKALRDGGRTYTELGSEVVGTQVITFTEDDPDEDAAWTIGINMCVESYAEYVDADGTVLSDPEEATQSASLVTANYDGVNEAWMLRSFEKGEMESCEEYFGVTDTDATTATSG